jgi:hypothetical protein
LLIEYNAHPPHVFDPSSARPYPAAHITAVSHPLPLTASEKESLRIWMNTLAAFFLLLPFSYLAAGASTCPPFGST